MLYNVLFIHIPAEMPKQSAGEIEEEKMKVIKQILLPNHC